MIMNIARAMKQKWGFSSWWWLSMVSLPSSWPMHNENRILAPVVIEYGFTTVEQAFDGDWVWSHYRRAGHMYNSDGDWVWSHYHRVCLTYNGKQVIEYGIITMELASYTTLVVIEFGLTTVELATCMMASGVATQVVIKCGLTTVELALQWKWHKMTSMSMHSIWIVWWWWLVLYDFYTRRFSMYMWPVWNRTHMYIVKARHCTMISICFVVELCSL